MLKCPKCENRLNENKRCGVCGYDRSIDYGRYPVFSKLTAEEIKKYEQSMGKLTEQKNPLEEEWMQWAKSIQAEIGALESKVGQDVIQKMKSYYKVIIQNAYQTSTPKPSIPKKSVTPSKMASSVYGSSVGIGNSGVKIENNFLMNEALAYHKEKVQFKGSLLNTFVIGDKCERVKSNSIEWSESEILNYRGNCYYFGSGRLKDYEKAVDCYKRAEKLGDVNALNNLGNCYFYGNGVKKNDEMAIEYYRKAAEKMNVAGTYNLAYCYLTGTGTKKNKGLADTLYQRAGVYYEVQKNSKDAER